MCWPLRLLGFVTMTQLPDGAMDFWGDPEEWKKHYDPDFADPKNWHEATKLFPPMDDEQLEAFAAQIKKDGLKHPIVLFEGKVLDGRNRAKACKIAKVPLRYIAVARGRLASPLKYVEQDNLQRLQLNKGQLACLAYKLIPRLQEEAELRQKAGKHGAAGGRGHKKDETAAQDYAEVYGKSAKLAGRTYGVSSRYVEMAITIGDTHKRPDLIEKVISDEMSIAKAEKTATAKNPIHDRFGAPPRTVLDAKQGYWTTKQAGWHSIGVSGGHNEQVNPKKESSDGKKSDDSMGSKFDPVLADAVYRWFMPMKGGHVLDPFAGEAIKGLVAGCRGLEYTGIEVRRKQVEANRVQAAELQLNPKIPNMRMPEWIRGNSLNLEALLPADKMYDLLFTSPPYGSLEVYEEDEENLSALDYPKFLLRYKKIIGLAVARLKPNRFAVFKVGDVRNDDGFYENFVGDTITCFLEEKLKLYNWAIYVMPPGDPTQQSLDPFRTTRKLGNKGVGHQHVLCFFKGDDPSVITQEFGILDVENLSKKPSAKPQSVAALSPTPAPPVEPESGAPPVPRRHSSKSSKARRAAALPAPFVDGAVPVLISSKSARIRFQGCGEDYIQNVCHGKCCETTDPKTKQIATRIPVTKTDLVVLHTIRSSVEVHDGIMVNPLGQKCQFKAESGFCSIHLSGQKPFGCWVSPFYLVGKEPHQTLVVRKRYIGMKCHSDFRETGLPAYKAFASSLRRYFGDEEAARITAHLDAGGGDITANMLPESYMLHMENEQVFHASAKG